MVKYLLSYNVAIKIALSQRLILKAFYEENELCQTNRLRGVLFCLIYISIR